MLLSPPLSEGVDKITSLTASILSPSRQWGSHECSSVLRLVREYGILLLWRPQFSVRGATSVLRLGEGVGHIASLAASILSQGCYLSSPLIEGVGHIPSLTASIHCPEKSRIQCPLSLSPPVYGGDVWHTFGSSLKKGFFKWNSYQHK